MTLDKAILREVVSNHLSHSISIDDVDGDGIFDTQWRSTETFYRHTEEYIIPIKRLAYKSELERKFPGMKGV